jgi:NAD(P)-dependent dehydrogenase (short-subunit alcohol dehydrogenase family)
MSRYLIVGGSHGIGAGVVDQLLASGSEVANVSRTPSHVDDVRYSHLTLDVTTSQLDATQLPDQLDGFVYCPGSINLGPIRQLNRDAMLQDYHLNVVAAIECLQAALPSLRLSGNASVVFFSTVAVGQGMTMHASVSAVKGAIEGLTRSLAAELAPKLRINCVAPGLTETPLSERFLSSDQKKSAMAEKHPLKRVGTVQDIAAMVTFLLKPESSWITGQVIGVDGGMSAIRG